MEQGTEAVADDLEVAKATGSLRLKTMRQRRYSPSAIALLLALGVLSSCASRVRTLADGVTLTQDIRTTPTSPLVVNAIKIDLRKPGVEVAMALAQDGVIENDPTEGREVVSSTVARTGALAGVNADFFPYTGDPLGMAVRNGELVSEPVDRAAIGITPAGHVLIDRLSFRGTLTTSSGQTLAIAGLNRQRGQDELVVYAPVFGACTGAQDGVEVPLTLDEPPRANTDMTASASADPSAACAMTIPHDGVLLSAHGEAAEWLMHNVHSGDTLTLRLDVTAHSGRDWSDVVQAAGGGPLLVQHGNVSIDGAEEAFSESLRFRRHPRTAAGVTASGELLLVTVDGRQSASRGMTLVELARLMKRLGAVEAINLDGGGSSSLSIRGIVANSPSDGAERPVANALIVYASPPAADYPRIGFADDGPLTVQSGVGRTLPLVDLATRRPMPSRARKGIIWGTTGGIGFVDQRGRFVPVKVGSGTVVAFAGEQRIELPVTVVPGTPSELSAEIIPDEADVPNAGKVHVRLSDENGNGIPNQTVRLSARGATPGCDAEPTDENGIAVFDVTWDTTADGAQVRVFACGLATTARLPDGS